MGHMADLQGEVAVTNLTAELGGRNIQKVLGDIMIEIEEMNQEEMQTLLMHVGYGHMGFSRDERPYVLPIHYGYDTPDIYVFTTEGLKTEFINANSEVCLQVEEVTGPTSWKSVIATGKAERLSAADETEHAMQIITARNPSLTPAINKMWVDVWGRSAFVAIYRIRPELLSGRKTK